MRTRALTDCEPERRAGRIRPLDPLRPEQGGSVDRNELDMAMQLIDSLRTGFEPDRYHDTYRDTLCEIIKQKREGETVTAPEPEKPAAAPDLMAALQASIDRANSDGNGKRVRSSLEGLSKGELYARAQEEDIPGRADMTKDQLVEALSG